MSAYESVLAICNAAASEVGARNQITSINPSDGSNEANQCAIWYDRTRRALLRTAHWGFARQQKPLQQVGDLYPDQTSPYPYLYAYDYPADCIKFRYILQPPILNPAGNVSLTPGATLIGPTWLTPSRSNRFIVTANQGQPGANNRLLVSNVYQALGVYTEDVIDPTQFDDLFSDALLSLMAYRLVTPLSGNVGMRQEYRQSAQEAILQARAADGNETIAKTDHTPDWINARMVGANNVYGFGPFSYGGVGEWGNWWGGFDDMSWGM